MAPVRWSRATLIESVQSASLVDVESGCHIWQQGTDSDGYAKFYFEGKHWRVSRAILFVVTGELHEHARHDCDNPPCVWREHLRWGTAKQNIADCHSRGRAAMNFQVKAGEANGRSKLTDAQRAEIVRRRLAGERAIDLAQEFGVGRARIHALCPGLVPGPGPVRHR